MFIYLYKKGRENYEHLKDRLIINIDYTHWNEINDRQHSDVGQCLIKNSGCKLQALSSAYQSDIG